MKALKVQPQRIVRFALIAMVVVGLLVSAFSVFASSQQQGNSAGLAAGSGSSSGSASGKLSTQDFQNAMRKLWEEHVTWTRLYIISVAADLPDKDVTAQRLLQNQADIGNAVKPFYGNAAGDKLTALLRDHILIAADLLAAVKSGDSAKATADSNKWYANADAIAVFLNSANPKNWPLNTLKAAMKMHLDQTLAEAAARLNGKFADDVKAYDLVENHILGMADVLSSGIIRQFPAQFIH